MVATLSRLGCVAVAVAVAVVRGRLGVFEETECPDLNHAKAQTLRQWCGGLVTRPIGAESGRLQVPGLVTGWRGETRGAARASRWVWKRVMRIIQLLWLLDGTSSNRTLPRLLGPIQNSRADIVLAHPLW